MMIWSSTLSLSLIHTVSHTCASPPPLPHWPQTPSCASWLALAAPYFCFVFCLFATVQKYFCGIWQDWRVGQQHPTIRAKRSLVFRLVYPRPSIFIFQARRGPVSWALLLRFPPQHIPPAVTIWAKNGQLFKAVHDNGSERQSLKQDINYLFDTDIILIALWYKFRGVMRTTVSFSA